MNRPAKTTPTRGKQWVATIAVRVIAIALGLFFLALGLWAMASPSSFYDKFALFPPYNRHFLHDAGAFQVGLGSTLLLASVWRDALFVALLGVGIGAAAHAISHVIDRDLGGRSADPYSLGVVAVVLLAAALLRIAGARREE